MRKESANFVTGVIFTRAITVSHGGFGLRASALPFGARSLQSGA